MSRSRARGEAAVWSVLPVAIVVIVVGGLFWSSVWIAFSASITAVTVRSTDLIDEDTVSEAEDADPDLAVAEAAYGPDAEDEETAEDPAAELDEVTDDPLGAAAYSGPVDELDEIALGTLGLATELGIGARSGPGMPRNDVLTVTAKAEELTARAEALTARNEELTVKLDGLTTKIEELEAKLEASGAVLAALPAAVASPVALGRGPEANTTVRTSQAAQSGRSPWVVSPLPEPGTRVSAGPVLLETRARGEAAIKEIRMQIDGVPVAVALEKQNETTWRGRASARVTAGSHTVMVSVWMPRGASARTAGSSTPRRPDVGSGLTRQLPPGRSARHHDTNCGSRPVPDRPLDGPLWRVLAAVPDRGLEAVIVLADVLVKIGHDRPEHLDGRPGERPRALVVRLERLVDVRQAEPVAGLVLLPDLRVEQAIAQRRQVAPLGLNLDFAAGAGRR